MGTSSQRGRWRLALAGLPLLAFAMVPSAMTTAAAGPTATNPPATSGDLDAAGTPCKPLPLVREVALLPDGTEQPASADDGLARRYYFALNGGTVTQAIPPPNFVPTAAPDAELETYGIPGRPTTDAKALDQWTADWSRWKRSDAVGLCQSQFSNFATTTSDKWAGGWSNNATFTSAEADFNQTAFDVVCPTASGYSTWSGIGGTTLAGKLIQTGTASTQLAPNDIVMWWEAIRPGWDTNQINFPSSNVGTGDLIKAITTYRPSDKSVNFTVYDVTAGFHKATSFMTMIAGSPAVNYYDSSTAEYISEQPFLLGVQLRLRKPHLKTTHFTAAFANGSPLSSWLGTRVNEIGGSPPQVQNSSYDASHAWDDTWVKCN